MMDAIGCSADNTGFFSTAKELNNIDAIFYGHDHNNDYWGMYEGIYMYYGRKSGYGQYGPPKGWQHGVRMIELTDNGYIRFKSWIREENGNIVDADTQPKNKYIANSCHKTLVPQINALEFTTGLAKGLDSINLVLEERINLLNDKCWLKSAEKAISDGKQGKIMDLIKGMILTLKQMKSKLKNIDKLSLEAQKEYEKLNKLDDENDFVLAFQIFKGMYKQKKFIYEEVKNGIKN